MSDLISRAEAIKEVEDLPNAYNGWSDTYDKAYIIGVLEDVPSATIEWIPCSERLPSEDGRYMVTYKAFSDMTFINLFYYGKPSMPNCKVKGMCWYRSDDEWGDVVYDDADILAWMPLPEPYKESEVEE